jgi:hypothetical protein
MRVVKPREVAEPAREETVWSIKRPQVAQVVGIADRGSEQNGQAWISTVIDRSSGEPYQLAEKAELAALTQVS